MTSYTVLESVRSRSQDLLREQFALDVLVGFSAEAKYLPCKYFYDAEGSRLFEQITDLDEYYLTSCEYDILWKAGPDIAKLTSHEPFEIVELGAGDGRKTKLLISAALEHGNDISYIPVDISESAISELVDSLRATYPNLHTQGIVGEYVDSLRHLEHTSPKRKLALFLGSNIGNFDYENALGFLRTLWKHLDHDDLLLVGFDLKKDPAVLTRAYNDTQGLTRDFNLNVLERINTELGGNFDPARFVHHALYNPVRGAMESYLLSLQEQTVTIDAIHKSFQFQPWEAIHLEYSYKYLPDDITAMAQATGFECIAQWTDRRNYFVDALWQVRKNP